MNEYIVKAEVVLHVQSENEEKAVNYVVDRVFDDLSVCFNDDDTIYIDKVIANVKNCTLVEVEEEE